MATPLAVVLNELIQNAVEHGLGDGQGTVTVELRGGGDEPVELVVHDDSRRPTPAEPGPVAGPPEGERSRGGARPQAAVHSPEDGLTPEGGLGLRLVRALVEEEMGGQFTLTHRAGRGSIATATIPPVERAG